MQQPSKNGLSLSRKVKIPILPSFHGKVTRRSLLLSLLPALSLSSCRKFRSDPKKITMRPRVFLEGAAPVPILDEYDVRLIQLGTIANIMTEEPNDRMFALWFSFDRRSAMTLQKKPFATLAKSCIWSLAERSWGFIPSKEESPTEFFPLCSPQTCRKTRSTCTMNSAPRSFTFGPSSSRRKARYAIFPISQPHSLSSIPPRLPAPLRGKPRLSSFLAHAQPRLCQGNGLLRLPPENGSRQVVFLRGIRMRAQPWIQIPRRTRPLPRKKGLPRPRRRQRILCDGRGRSPPQRYLRI